MITFQNIDLLKKDLIRINNLKGFLIDIPNYHPDTPKYEKIWNEYYKYCIEGFWGNDIYGYRFMPATLFFYGNFFKIEHRIKEQKTRQKIKPIIRDIDWLIHYAYLVAQGFSGFQDDENYTSHILAKTWDKNKLPKTEEELSFFNTKGQLKTYINPLDYLKQLHEKPLGKALFWNPACNLMIFGSRGGE